MAKFDIRRRDLAVLALGGLLPTLPSRALAQVSTYTSPLTLNSKGQAYFNSHYWGPQSASNTYAIKQATCASGLPAHRFEVRSGDNWNNQPYINRAEFCCTDKIPFNRAIWFSYAFYVHSGIATKWNLLGQFHHTPDSCDSGGISPPFAIELRPSSTYGELLCFVRRYNANAAGTPSNTTTVMMKKHLFSRNVWHHVVGCIVFDWQGAGSVDLWYDGTKILAEHGVPIGFNDVTGPYFKFGIYREDVPTTQVVEYANVQLTYNSLSNRIASPLPI